MISRLHGSRRWLTFFAGIALITRVSGVPPLDPASREQSFPHWAPPRPATQLSHLPQATVDVLMVGVPQAKALSLLPKLRAPHHITAAEAELLHMILTKEAVLIGWPELSLHHGTWATSEAVLEHRIPSEFEQPTEPTLGPGPPVSSARKMENILAAAGATVPRSYETRNLAVTVEATATISPDARSAAVSISTSYTRLHRFQSFRLTEPGHLPEISARMPVYGTDKVSCRATLVDGERRLLFVGKSAETPDRIDFFIVGARIYAPVVGPESAASGANPQPH